MLIGIMQPSVAGLSEEEALLQDQLYLFWKHARVQHTAQGVIGVSWLELFARFQAIGGQLSCTSAAGSQHISFKSMLDTFITKSKSMFMQQGSDDVAELLKPCRGAWRQAFATWCSLPSTCNMHHSLPQPRSGRIDASAAPHLALTRQEGHSQAKDWL